MTDPVARTCVIPDCDARDRGAICARRMCRAHYNRWQRYGDPGPGHIHTGTCSHPECDPVECLCENPDSQPAFVFAGETVWLCARCQRPRFEASS